MSRKIMVILGVVLVLLGVVWAAAAATGKAGKGVLGVSTAEVTSEVAGDYGVKAGEGVIIEDVTGDSPAEAAGLRVNDIIIKVNSGGVTGPAEFRNQISKMKPGDSVELTYLRGGKEKTISVKLANREKHEFNWTPWRTHWGRSFHFEGPPWEWGTPKGEKRAYAGLRTQDLSEGLAAYFKVESGALVSEVVKGSPAEQAGLKAGDVITKIGDEKIDGESDVREAIRSHKVGDAVDFVIRRDGTDQTIKVTLGEHRSMDTGSNTFEFGEDGGASGMAVVPNEKDMEDLRESLRDLQVQLDSLPDVHWDSIKAQIDIPGIKVEVNKLKSVEVRDQLKHSIEKVKEELAKGSTEFRNGMDRAKDELLKAKARISTKVAA
jgi:serine protease Do